MDLVWFQYLNGLVGTDVWLDTLVIFFAKYFGFLMLAGLGTYLLFKQDKRTLKMTVSALVLAFAARFVFTELIRWFYFNPRPFSVLEDVNQLVSHSANASFPSGHVAFFFALATGIWFFRKRVSVLFFAGAFLLGASRVIAGIHWPYDIIGGIVVGIASGILIRHLWRRFRQTSAIDNLDGLVFEKSIMGEWISSDKEAKIFFEYDEKGGYKFTFLDIGQQKESILSANIVKVGENYFLDVVQGRNQEGIIESSPEHLIFKIEWQKDAMDIFVFNKNWLVENKERVTIEYKEKGFLDLATLINSAENIHAFLERYGSEKDMFPEAGKATFYRKE